ncbi:aminomethyltransferase [Candidatus Frackibacter sp. WG12]|uniref:glycine cleavage system aminomethyltransferase GcvT n=1 Tax=unclassified Candidatus Frackibacter TaxID=2648818 RepID=UPI00088C7641|nr:MULTISPECIES: glycine cleavage system aminomethyltransferase GcvT [unclassified Candidatus Frackibacter]SDC36796.1 aminomethyltransferase [Candidatus Frackibacter sp. WG11]SEM63140.1 aminomethyltransferase [Candidatus Frackibacter sp. WG12]
MSDNLKRTPLYQSHVDTEGKIVEFGGWEMPVQYSGVIAEHQAVRNQAGIFDVSHMGEIRVSGEDALKFLQKLLVNDLSEIEDNQVQYTMMCYPDGGVVDDLLVYRYNEDDYLLVVNASNTDKDYKWIKDKEEQGVRVVNQSDEIAEVALQGPLAEEVLQELTDFDLSTIKYFWFEDSVEIAGVEAIVSRTGYTGEDGFEIYTANEGIEKIWNAILDAGQDKGVVPVGLGARDTLRFEANLPLYGHEIGKEKNPLEAGLRYFVALDKEEEFIGQDALKEIEANGYQRKLVGLEMIDRGIPRDGYDLLKDDEKIGVVTTGSYAPTLDKNVGLGYVKTEYAEEGTEIEVQIRRRKCKAKVVALPFYRREK